VTFSAACPNGETYDVDAIFSANNGADVGSFVSTETH
jgi:hypothetical protein